MSYIIIHIKCILRNILPAFMIKQMVRVKNSYFDGYALKSYSQDGEDMILQRFYGHKSKGLYVDIGAHHPMRFSNTYVFYKKGWSGINIDAMPGSMKIFKKFRKRDLNLEVPVSNSSQEMTYYIFNETALNTFSKELSEKAVDEGKYVIVDTVKMRPRSLSDLLDEHLEGQKIDFLDIDVEGLDYEVLLSNNWIKYRPTIVLIEQLATTLDALVNNKVSQFMKEKSYLLYAKTVNTAFYIDSQYELESLYR
ncbi:MAG: FkbM family methyltransferase [Sedimentisphaerales bacterium]|nr:FkbM family methyltransferase [Sedimentisphaerales bacterium]